MRTVPVPSWWGVGLSLVLVAVALAVAVRAHLDNARDIGLAALRAAVQLVAVGALLKVLFQHTGLPGSLAWVVAMVVIAGRVAAGRGRGLPGATSTATFAIAVGVVATLGVLVGAGIISTKPFVVVPVGGMVVSGSMQSASMVLARLRDEMASSRRQVEARLALGMTGADAFAPHRRTALRTALNPAIDQTKVVGLISLPGAMTGLIIAGVSPLLAIRYQIVVMYMLLGAYAIAGVVAALVTQRRVFDDAERLLPLVASAPGRRRGRMGT
ncbi:MAG: UDP-glucose/iron transport system permease protein [Frankiaceae bacterium]|nr:UDP-glucose/iron transport system permease protein [Frankiaceae bacterium]